MGLLLLLAVEASSLEEEGFGLNFDLLDTNLINLVIIIGVLIVFGRKFLGETLSSRKATIESEIKAAEERKQKAASELASQQQKLAQAQAEAEAMIKDAHARAEAARTSILEQADRDIERLQTEAQKDVSSQQDRVAAELRQYVAERALAAAESQCRAELNEDSQQQLINRSIAMLGG
ncbi:MAG: F0F1 ATP synthase subunit B [Leptolyngbyaceae bacterium]|nr:F0F1 ATP synthase subunit B [Leptolyngbyaceae bacterium]